MKITIIKKSDSNVNTMALCPWIVDMPGDAKK
jgi:hypothetical protein